MEADLILPIFEASFAETLRFATQNLVFKMEMLEAFLIRQACDILEGVIPRRENEREALIGKEHMERLYVLTLMWSVGAFLELDDRSKLEKFLRSNDKIRHALPAIDPDSDQTMYDFFVDEDGTPLFLPILYSHNDFMHTLHTRTVRVYHNECCTFCTLCCVYVTNRHRLECEGNWKHWSTKVSEYTYPPDSTPEYSTILVPNVDNVRTDFLIHTISKQEKAVLLIGEQGAYPIISFPICSIQ